jgi:hypothetical protein
LKTATSTLSDINKTGTITYSEGGHGWHTYSTIELLRIMADHITAHAPECADTEAWKY